MWIWLDLKELFRNFPAKIWCFGIMPGICFAVAVNALFFIGHLTGIYFPPASSKFIGICVFFWLAIWVSCLLLFAGYKITDEKIAEKIGRIFM